MALRHDSDYDSRMNLAIDEIKSLLAQKFPGIAFEVGPGYDPDGVYLDAILDTEDFDTYSDEVNDLVRSRVMELWGQGIDLFVIPGLPPHRIAERWKAIKAGLL